MNVSVFSFQGLHQKFNIYMLFNAGKMGDEGLKGFKVFDTTLRDGEQTPGVSLSVEQKILIAEALDKLNVDVIEAGSAITSKGEQEAIKEIAERGFKAEICSFARILQSDINVAMNCGVDSVFIVCPSSDIHISSKFKKSREEVLQQGIETVEYARDHGLTVEFGAEDASRADFDYVRRLFKAAEEAGASRVCYCDTVGVLTPEKTFEIFKTFDEELGIETSIHCHDDFGLATINSVFAIKGGAEQVHATINGIGERAGNASLEEIVMASEILYGYSTGINKQYLYNVSKLVSKLTGVLVAPNKAIVGDNAFTHESGIHTHAIMRDTTTYEPITPEIVGRKRRLVLGKHAGRASVEAILKELGYRATPDQMKDILSRIKEIGDKGKRLTDADVQAIAETVLEIKKERRVELIDLNVVSGKNLMPTASVKLKIDGKEVIEAGVGLGPVDAAINAIKKGIKNIADVTLEEYHVDSITGGTDALVEVVVKLSKGDKLITSRGARTDIIMASVEAVVEGINRLIG